MSRWFGCKSTSYRVASNMSGLMLKRMSASTHSLQYCCGMLVSIIAETWDWISFSKFEWASRDNFINWLFFLNLVDFAVYDEKKKLLTGQLRKYPEKLIIYCKDLRVFNFCLRYTKEEEVKRVSIGTSFVFFFSSFLSMVLGISFFVGDEGRMKLILRDPFKLKCFLSISSWERETSLSQPYSLNTFTYSS